MKKTIGSQSFALLAAALLMVGAVGCSSAPVHEEPLTESAAVSTQTESQSESRTEDITAQAPVVDQSLDDTMSGTTTSMDPLSAPSSLGASSSGRGH